jgi:hypothetical protein
MRYVFFFPSLFGCQKIDNWIRMNPGPCPDTFYGRWRRRSHRSQSPPPTHAFGSLKPFFLPFQDASILAALLSHPLATRDTASQVLGIYSSIRQPLTTEVGRRSRANGEHFGLRRIRPDASPSQLQEVVKNIQDNFDQVSETDAAQDMQRAMELLQAELTA